MDIRSVLNYLLDTSLETKAAVLFIVFLGIFLIVNRKKLTVQKIFFPVLYALLYKTKLGLKRMDSWAKKHPVLMHRLAVMGIWVGFIGMVVMSGVLIVSILQSFFVKDAPAAVGLVLPIKAKGVFHVPFFYWIISLFLLAVVHEFAHGVVARRYNIPVKSSGFAFLCVLIPFIPAAFVEPDEKVLAKKKVKEQLALFAAGPFANVIFAVVALLVFLAMTPLVNTMVVPDGVKIATVLTGNITYPAESAGLKEGDIIYSIDGNKTGDLQTFVAVLSGRKAGDSLLLETSAGTKTLELVENPSNSSLGFMGIVPSQNTRYADAYGEMQWIPKTIVWIFGLFVWLHILNLGIGLFNLLPAGPLDGGRMLLAVLLAKYPKNKAQKIWSGVSLFFLILLIAGIFHSCTI